MVLRRTFVVARSGMRRRATLMHRLLDGQKEMTVCGVDIRLWSRSYTHQELEAILCRRCNRA
jgi:hypothetical protein